MNLLNTIRIGAALALALGCTTLTSTTNALAGSVSGPTTTVEVVRAHTTDIYHVTFRGGEPASVFVRGDGDTDLDLYIYDENGNLVAVDDDPTDTCLCCWTPRWTGVFRIEVRNLGGVSNRYALRIN